MGYRHSIDPILLADFVEARKGDRVIDLGTGSGVIPLCLAERFRGIKIVGLELQEGLVKMARENVHSHAERGNEKAVEIIKGDIRDVKSLFDAESFDIVVGNPPYRKADDGRINPDRERAIARHEIEITLSEFIKAGKYLVKNLGSVNIIYHPYRLFELLSLMGENRITPKRIQFVHPKIDSKAEMVMVEGIKNGRHELTVMKPLILNPSPLPLPTGERIKPVLKEVKE
ncbi:MAG: methyltransferase [Nitrospinae bacterium]|nr:methyltransferase [Nitrospinota bacterium]